MHIEILTILRPGLVVPIELGNVFVTSNADKVMLEILDRTHILVDTVLIQILDGVSIFPYWSAVLYRKAFAVVTKSCICM